MSYISDVNICRDIIEPMAYGYGENNQQLIIAKSFQDVRHLYRMLTETIANDAGYKALVGSYTYSGKGSCTIKFKNGSYIKILPLDNPDQLRGRRASNILFDDLIDPDVATELMQKLVSAEIHYDKPPCDIDNLKIKFDQLVSW